MAEPASKIFVIDDDESVRASLGRLLHSAGYDCAAFASAEEFLTFLQSQAASAVDDACAIVDIRMPGMDGIELMHRLRSTYPALRVVLITASNDEYSKSASAAAAVTLLQKPFDDVTLFSAIAAAGTNAISRTAPANSVGEQAVNTALRNRGRDEQ